MKTTAAARIALLTDVEGNWQYVRNFVKQSSCLQLFYEGTKDETLELRDDCMLVFGGDAGDKGDHTLRCNEQLVKLKKRYPDRVVLLVGNRDANKMRFTSELHDTEMDLHSMARRWCFAYSDMEVLESPTWVPESKRMTLKKYLVEQVTKTNGELMPDNDIEVVNTKTNRLKWMLDHTMGSGGDFERRRSELVFRQEVGDMNNVTDENVVRSYVDSLSEGGVLRDFLLHGNLAFVAHQTLFVHGGIINGDDGAGLSALGRVPDEPSKHFDSVLEWVDKLNAWYRSQIQDWINYPHWNAEHSSRGGNELLKYIVPNYAGSVVVGRHLLASGMPTPLPDKTASLLSKSGIRRVIIGHTPHGNCPTVIKQPPGQTNTCPSDANISRCHSVDGVSFEDVIMCDTSYSDIQARDNRGSAASEVIVEPFGRVSVIGILEDGQRIEYDPDEDPWVGRWLRDGTMVKARLVDRDGSSGEELYLVFRVENGYSYTYNHRTVTQLRAIGLKA